MHQLQDWKTLLGAPGCPGTALAASTHAAVRAAGPRRSRADRYRSPGRWPRGPEEQKHAFDTVAYVPRTTSIGAWSLRPRSAATFVRTRHDVTAASVLVSAYRWSSMNGRLPGLKYVCTSSAEWR